MEFTTFADTAACTAAVAVDERPVPDKIHVAGHGVAIPEPIVYEDFSLRSAAGIFQSNLTDGGTRDGNPCGVDDNGVSSELRAL